jgi:hypothetical protein
MSRRPVVPVLFGALAVWASAAESRDLQPISILEPDPAMSRPIEVLGAAPRVATAAEWMREVLEDGSLQTGDIVMFEDGPRIFVQDGGFPPWAEEDFAAVATTTELSDRQRRAILSLTTPPEPLRVTIGRAD